MKIKKKKKKRHNLISLDGEKAEQIPMGMTEAWCHGLAVNGWFGATPEKRLHLFP